MRPFLGISLLLAAQACDGTVCGETTREFVLNDDVTAAGIRPSEALAQVPESYVARALNKDLEEGDVQIDIHSRAGDPVFVRSDSTGPNAAQWCGSEHLSVPVTVELTTWFGGVVTLAGERLFYERDSDWNVNLNAFSVLDARGFGEQRDVEGELFSGSEFTAAISRDSHSEWGSVWLIDTQRIRGDALNFERQVEPDEEDW